MQNNPYKLVALLPMKAHSSRVTSKNFRLFAGRPLFRWILDALLEVEAIEKIVINTDARNLLRQHGMPENDRILIRDRPQEICGTTVSMNRVIEDDLEAVSSELYLMTHATNPLLRSATISSALECYRKKSGDGYDSLFTVNEMQTRFYRNDGSPVNHDPDNLVPTQDLEVWYEENSNLYAFTKDSFERTNARIGSNPVMYTTPHLESFDIDDVTGWHLAEIVALSRFVSASAEAYQKSL